MPTNDYFGDPRALNVPWVFSPFFESMANERLDPRGKRLAETFREDGYLVLEEPVVDDETIDRAVADLAGNYDDAQTGGSDPSRRLDGWQISEAVAEIARAPKVVRTLEALYGRAAFPFQTLNFERGTQQRAHSDTIHFHCVPQRFMAGVWVALEDIHPDSGPLVVYPRSHRLPVFDAHDLGIEAEWERHDEYEDAIEAIVEAEGFEGRKLTPQKGQAVIWAANLLHGGSAVVDAERTRLSQASHYYFEDCFYYQPAASDPFVGRLALKDVLDIGTGCRVPNVYRGRPVEEWMSQASVGSRWRRIFGLRTRA